MVFHKCVLLKAPLFKYPLAANLSELILTNSKSKWKYRCSAYLFPARGQWLSKTARGTLWHLQVCKKYLKVGSIPVLFLSTTSILKELAKRARMVRSDKQVSSPLMQHRDGVFFFLQKVLGKLRRNDRLWLCALGFATLHAGEGKVLSDEGLQKKSLFPIKGKQMSPMPEKPDCKRQNRTLGPLANKAGSNCDSH